MSSKSLPILLAVLPAFLWACGGDSPDATGATSDSSSAATAGSTGTGGSAATSTSASSSGTGGSGTATAATAWTVSGSIQLKSFDPTTNLKIVASINGSANSASTYAGSPVAFAPTGSPPSGSFSLTVDTTKLAHPDGPGIISLFVFQDSNDNGVNDVGEANIGLAPMMGSAVWCNAAGCELDADFQHAQEGDSGSGSGPDAGYTIDVTGWYASECSDFGCPSLISTAGMALSGVKLTHHM